MKVAILTEQQYQEMELWYPYYRLMEAGHQPVLVGPEAGKTYPSKHGYPAKAEVAAKDVSAAEFGAVVVPGGFSPDYLRRSEAVLKLVRDAAAAGKPVAAICHGPWVLCSAGVLKGRKATSFHSIKDDVRHAGAEWTDAEVVVDGPIITSRTPDDLPAFMAVLLKVLG